MEKLCKQITGLLDEMMKELDSYGFREGKDVRKKTGDDKIDRPVQLKYAEKIIEIFENEKHLSDLPKAGERE